MNMENGEDMELDSNRDPGRFAEQAQENPANSLDTTEDLPFFQTETQTPEAGAQPVDNTHLQGKAPFSYSAYPRTAAAAAAAAGISAAEPPAHTVEYRQKETSSPEEKDSPAVNIPPLEERNALFAHPRADVSQLPPPQVPGEVTLEGISEKLLKRHPLVFSEKHPLPTRGDQQKRKEPEEEEGKEFFIPQPSLEPVILDSRFFTDDRITLGAILTAARQAAGFTVDQVSEKTRISSNYITALEQDEISNLHQPLPPVFVSAYVRTLCRMYRLNPDGTALAMKHLETITSSIPPKLIEDMKSDALVNEQEDRRIRRFIYGGIAVLALFVLLVVWGIILLLFPGDASPETQPEKPGEIQGKIQLSAPAENPAPPADPAVPDGNAQEDAFSEDNLRSLNAPQLPETSVLEISPRPQVRR